MPRSILAIALFAVLSHGSVAVWAQAPKSAEARGSRPNVLFIAIDDLNDWPAFLKGQPGVQTPNLDRLAGRGVAFTRAYCAAPACNPSRASTMCGIRPSTSGVYSNSQPWRPVMPKAVTLTQHFMQHGYEAVAAGKIFHGSFNEPTSFDDYVMPKQEAQPEHRSLNGIPATSHFDWGPLQANDSEMQDYHTAQYGIDYLAKKHDKPFFLSIGFTKPHLPWYVPQKYFDQFPLESIVLPKVKGNDLDDIPPAGRKIAKPEGDHAKVVQHNQWKAAVQGYLASILFLDTQVGRLIDAFEKSPHAKDTIVVLWGDHGWHLGEKEHWRKFALWEEATRVPLIISVPGVTSNGVQCDRTVSLLDLYPTLAELCGLPSRAELEGNSIVPLLKDPTMAWDKPVLTTHGRNNHAVRSERYRYIRYADGSEELYDHQSDPLEWQNLATDSQYTSTKSQLAAALPKVNAPDAPSQRGDKRKRDE